MRNKLNEFAAVGGDDEDHEAMYRHHKERAEHHWGMFAHHQDDYSSDKADKHLEKSEHHESEMDRHAAAHFKKTGKKIVDTGYSGNSKFVSIKKEETETSTMKKSLVESTAELISQQSELSEMGDKPIHNLPVKKYYDSPQKKPNKMQESADLADIKRQHTNAVAEIGRHRANHANWARAVHPAARDFSRDMNPHSDRLHGAIKKARGLRSNYKKAGGNDSDLSKDQAEDFKEEGDSLSEELRTRKLGTHEEEFHTAFDKHLNDLDASNSKSASPEMKNTLRKRSQAHLQIALMSASMHYRKHGSPIKVKGNKYDELISSLRSPLVTKA